MLKPVLITPPKKLPVSVSELKPHVRADSDDDDAVLQFMLSAATAKLDGYDGITGRALMQQTWAQSWPGFCSDVLRLALAPLQSVTSVTYFDSADAPQTVSAANYRVHTDARGAYVKLKSGLSWPSTADRDDAVTVTYVCGAATAADVDPKIKQAIRLLAAHFYENREGIMAGAQPIEVPLGFDFMRPVRRV